MIKILGHFVIFGITISVFVLSCIIITDFLSVSDDMSKVLTLVFVIIGMFVSDMITEKLFGRK